MAMLLRYSFLFEVSRNILFQVRNCRLVNLVDLDQSKSYVRGKIGDYLSDLINIGAAGFRVDACKHMWPGDLEAIFGALPDLNTSKGFAAGSRAFIAQDRVRDLIDPYW